MSAPAGWYPNGDDWETYWDGSAWTDQHRPKQLPTPTAPPAPPAPGAGQAATFTSDGSLMKFKSHIDGKNADVEIYPDRIEWKREGGVSGAKVAAGMMTLGLSMIATGVKSGRSGSEMIPMKAITGVTTKRDGMINTVVSVTSSSLAIGFRVSHKEAEQIKTLLHQLVLSS